MGTTSTNNRQLDDWLKQTKAPFRVKLVKRPEVAPDKTWRQVPFMCRRF